MLDLLTKLIKFVVVDSDIYANIDMIFHNGMNSTKKGDSIVSFILIFSLPIYKHYWGVIRSDETGATQSGIRPHICEMRWLRTETAMLLHTSA